MVQITIHDNQESLGRRASTGHTRIDTMSKVVSDEGLDLQFRAARTHNVWLDKPVDDALLRQVYDLA